MDEKIVLFGQSCVGKTTFAKLLTTHHYYCFDALFPWHLIESFNMSIASALDYVIEQCVQTPFVLDGWHTSDLIGDHLPNDVKIYLIFAEYSQIIKQYRIPVLDFNEHRFMYDKWYKFPYKEVRYFFNNGVLFNEITNFIGV